MQIESGLQTVDQFCAKHNISRGTFYRNPPTLTKIGAATRVAPQHEVEWLAKLPVVEAA